MDPPVHKSKKYIMEHPLIQNTKTQSKNSKFHNHHTLFNKTQLLPSKASQHFNIASHTSTLVPCNLNQPPPTPTTNEEEQWP